MPILNTPDMNVYSADPFELPLEPEAEEPQGPSTQDLDELSKFLEEIFNQYDSSATRKEVLDDIKESRKAYSQKTEETTFPWKGASNMITPLTRIAVDEMEPRLVTSIVGREPFLRVSHRPGVTNKEEAVLVEKYINYVFTEEVKLFPFAAKMVHKALLDGTAFPMLYWSRQEEIVRRKDPQGQPIEQPEVVFDGPKLSLIPAEHIWIADDVDEEDWEDAILFRFVREYTERELIERILRGEEGWIAENIEGATTTKELTEAQRIRGVSEEEEPTEIRKISCLECYCKWNGERLVVLLDRESFKILRLRRQVDIFGANRKPIRRLSIFREEGVSWGEPIYNVIKGIQDGTDAMWNRCVNSADITMTPWGLVKRGLGGQQTRLKIFPGHLLGVDDPTNYTFPNLSMFKPTEFVPLLSMYKVFYEKTINVTDYMQGMESQVAGKKGSTATGTLAILQEGKVKHEYRGTLLQHEFLDLLLNLYDLVVDNMPQQDVYPVTGQQIMQFSLTKDYMFGLGPSSVTANRFVDRKETEDFMMVMQPFMSLLNPMSLLNDLLRSYGKEPNDYIDPELNQLVQQFLARKENIKALAAMGIPEQMAAQLTDQGVTPKNVGEFLKQIGEAHGQRAAIEEFGPVDEGESSGAE